MEELYAVIMTRLFLSALGAGVATLVICFLLNAIVMPFTRLKGVKKAEQEGRMVRAILVKTITPHVTDVNESGMHATTDGIFRYEYNGKTYQYKGHYHRTPPTEEILYFRKNPAKARTSMEYGKLESEWKIIFLGLLVIGFIATFFFF